MSVAVGSVIVPRTQMGYGDRAQLQVVRWTNLWINSLPVPLRQSNMTLRQLKRQLKLICLLETAAHFYCTVYKCSFSYTYTHAYIYIYKQHNINVYSIRPCTIELHTNYLSISNFLTFDIFLSSYNIHFCPV